MFISPRLFVVSLLVLQIGLAQASALSCIEQGTDTTKAQAIINFTQDSAGNVQKSTLTTSGNIKDGLFYFYAGQREVEEKGITMVLYSTRQKSQLDKVKAADTLAIYIPNDEQRGIMAKEFHTDNRGNITNGKTYVCADLSKDRN